MKERRRNMVDTKKQVLPIFTEAEWTPELLEAVTEEVKKIAEEELELSYYPIQIRIITSEQMLDAYASVGMPVGYAHWSFGKQFLKNDRAYRSGQMGLAYEIVINTDPCLVFCMEDNTMTMQSLVIAHAGFGHNAFFKNNYLFQRWTNPDGIIDYLVFAKDFIQECEDKYGIDAVSETLDACHALQNYGVDRYKRSVKLSFEQEKARMEERAENIQQNLNVIWRTLPKPTEGEVKKEDAERFPKDPEENLLYFVEKNAPHLPDWKREIIRIVRKIAQYFYPQIQTKVMNEGFACFTHYYIMTRLHEKGLITEGSYQEFLHSHTNVVFQPEFDSPFFRGINPYALGFGMFMDIKRICENPTDEDRKWFPDMAGKPWLPVVKYAMENFKDESFILQYLSPRLIRKFGLFAIQDDDREDELEVTAIHDGDGYQRVREALAGQHDLGVNAPNIQVESVDVRGTRECKLVHHAVDRRPLDEKETGDTLLYFYQLWEYPVSLYSVAQNGVDIEHWKCEDGKTVRHAENTDVDFSLD
ncbi:MAG: SpoVR family protein [bacterium]|nr:SpoVR family protein [bacterium]